MRVGRITRGAGWCGAALAADPAALWQQLVKP
jgi:hypothetical protein